MKTEQKLAQQVMCSLNQKPLKLVKPDSGSHEKSSSALTLALILLGHIVLIYVALDWAKLTPKPTEIPQPMLVSLLAPAAQIDTVDASAAQQTSALIAKTEVITLLHSKVQQKTAEPVLAVEQVVENKQIEPAHAAEDSAQSEPVQSTESTATQLVSAAAGLPENKVEQVSQDAIEPPRFGVAYLNNPAPDYPPMSRRNSEEGRVVMKVLVSVDGAAQEVQLQKSSGFERLDLAAIDAVKRWRFIPAQKNQQAVRAYVLVPMRFSLNE